MKTCDYKTLQQTSKNITDKFLELEQSKQEELVLPAFAREVPLSAKKREKNNIIEVQFTWPHSASTHIRAERIVHRKDENIEELFRIEERDGADCACTSRNGKTYLLRKTTRQIAEALLNAHGKIKGAIEAIVGWLKTVLGSVYVVSKVEQEAWSFDRRIAKNTVKHLDAEDLDAEHKKRFCEIITEKIAELHKGTVVLGNFTLNKVLLTGNSALFTDLRDMRVTRKRSVTVEEFKKMLQYLFALGIAEKADIFYSIAVYAVANEESCNEWYMEKTGKMPQTTYDVTRAIETEI